MKMGMTKELARLLNLIGEALRYLKPDENKVVLPEIKILKEGLDKQDIKNCLKYLSDNGVARVDKGYAPVITKSTIGTLYAEYSSVQTDEYSQVEYIFSINREKIKPLLFQGAKFQTKDRDVDKKRPSLIRKDSRGDYFYDGKRIEMSKETIYYNVFDVLYSECDQDGFLSYVDIETQLVKRGFAESRDEAARKKRINNALLNKQEGLFKFSKVNGKRLQNKTLDGQVLIRAIRGRGIQFNNPIL